VSRHAWGAGGIPPERTLILSRRDVQALMTPDDYLEAVREGFRAAAGGRAQAPAPLAVAGEGGAFHAKAARIELDRPYVALKLNGNFPDNGRLHGLPTIQGAILLCDGRNGALLAVMDSIEVTLRRTAAATALAAQYLARRDSRTLLVCGCGAQAVAHLAALRQVLPIDRGFAWDCDLAKAAAFAAASNFIRLTAVTDLSAAAAESDVILTCTTAQAPFLHAGIVPAGAFVAAVGSDSPDKNEIGPDLMVRALVVADVLDQCVEMGDLRHALAAGALCRGDVHGELADLVSGRCTGRTAMDQITLFDSTGVAIEDVASAVTIYRRASARGGLFALALDEAA
jgi:alanine dehydrogenase